MWSCCVFLCALITSEITFLMDHAWAPSPTPDHRLPVGQAPGAFFTRALPAMGVQAQATPTPGISLLTHKLSAVPTPMTVRRRSNTCCVRAHGAWGAVPGGASPLASHHTRVSTLLAPEPLHSSTLCTPWPPPQDEGTAASAFSSATCHRIDAQETITE